MENRNNQSLMSLLTPPESGEGIARFLGMAAEAVGCRTDADFARVMNLPPTAIANWRRRGRVSQGGLDWFRNSLIPAVAYVSPHTPQPNDTTANAVLVDLLVASSGNPLGATVDTRFVTAMALPGLIALSRLLVGLVRLQCPYRGGFGDSDLVRVLGSAMPAFRSAAMFERFTS